MTTLRIEHPISDFTTWLEAFDRFAAARERAGVTAHRIRRPEDDDHYVLIDLDFTDSASAHGFLKFLRDVVWATPANAPALVGDPVTRVLVDAG